MKSKKFIVKHKKLVVAAVVIAALAVVAVLRGPGQSSNLAEEIPEFRDIHTYKSFVGNVEPSTDTSVISRVSQQVTRVLVEEGDTVREGDVIAVIDSSSVEQNITKTELSLSTSEASNSYNISDAQRNYDNYREALDSGLNSSLNSAQNTLDNAYKSLEQAKEDYDTAIWRMDNGVYTNTQTQYNARETAQETYHAAEEKVRNLQAAYDAAREAYEDAQAATVSGADAAFLDGLQQAYLDAESALNAGKAELESDAAAEEKVRNLQAAYDTAREAYEEAQAEASETAAVSLDGLQQAYLDAESALNAGKAELESAKAALDKAESDFAWAKQNIIETKQAAIDSAQTSYDTAVKNYEVTKLSVEQQLETYKAALDKTKGTANTAGTELELQQLKDSLADYTIYAPCDGTVTALNITEGSMVSNGASVATISNLSTMKVAINVDEYSILDTGAGSSVTIMIDSIGKSYEGTITRVSDIASLNNGVSYFEATVDFTADEHVKSGMSVEVRLTSTDRKGILTVSADALHYNDDNTAYVLVKNGDSQEVRGVETGVTDGNYVEILSGLEAEDIVLVAPSAGSMFPGPGPGMRGE